MGAGGEGEREGEEVHYYGISLVELVGGRVEDIVTLMGRVRVPVDQLIRWTGG